MTDRAIHKSDVVRSKWIALLRWQLLLFALVAFTVTLVVAIAVCDRLGQYRSPYYVEDVAWGKFKKALQKDPAFKDVSINMTKRKHIHWASGTVPSHADLDRLKLLAAECGISDRRLDGPYAHSVSLFIRDGAYAPATNSRKRSQETPE